MAQDKGEWMARRDAIECKSDVRVTHAATCNFDHNFTGSRFEDGKFAHLYGTFGSK
jgi:hypothetical protein